MESWKSEENKCSVPWGLGDKCWQQVSGTKLRCSYSNSLEVLVDLEGLIAGELDTKMCLG
jgi:hypothetical protein